MRAVVIEHFGQVPTVREVDAPELTPDGVLVTVEATGLCRSDWHGWAGHDADITLPHVPGHEFIGWVAARGSDVDRIQVGDRILVPFISGCGSCAQCSGGDAQVCPNQTQPGFTHWGSFAEQVVVRHADFNALIVPDSWDARDLVGLGCRFATSFRGLHARAALTAGETLLVLGCGGVGLSAIMIGAALGADVIAVDVSPAALEAAERAGAIATVNSSDHSPEDLAAQLRDRCARIDVSVDALGSPATATAGLLALAPRGRHVQIGLLPRDPVLPLGRIIRDELSLLGSHGMPAVDYPAMLSLIEDGRLRPSALVGREIGLDEAAVALASMDSAPPTGMTLIRP